MPAAGKSTRPESLFAGFDRTAGDGFGATIGLKPNTLLRHMMALGSSGSGKTVLCKVVAEEFLRHGVPAICIDPQGDLCSLAMAAKNPEALREKGVDPALAREFAAKIDPVIFTPASRKGVAMCADPVRIDLAALASRERVHAVTGIATMLVSLLGYDLDSDDGAGLIAVFDRALNDLNRSGDPPRSLDAFARWLEALDEEARRPYARYLDDKKIEQACRKLARLDVGARRLLFHEGLPLDIDLLLGRGPLAAARPGKTRLSIIYLNTLHSQEDKEFFVAALVEQLYGWMLKNPGQDPQALFYIDEVAPFIPPVRKPACKPGLNLLFKQARKYGVCCLMATQNPADVDYKAMAQFGTWAIGRLTTRQDMKKIQPTVKSLDPVHVEAIMQELPAQKPGEFVLISPDNFRETRRLKTRWLYSEHATLDEERIEDLVDGLGRERFSKLEEQVRGRQDKRDEARPATPETKPAAAAQAAAIVAPASPEPKAQEPTAEPPPADRDENAHYVDALAGKPSATAAEYAQLLGLSETKARRLLHELMEAGHASRFKDGRGYRYWALRTGLRPDLGMERPYRVIVPTFNKGQAAFEGMNLRSRKLLGLVGEEEDLAGAELEHRLLLRLSFREKVTRVLWKRIFGRKHDERLDNIYLHPRTLQVAVYNPREGIRFEQQPEEYASRIEDFDGVVSFEEKPPQEIRFIEEEWKTRPADDVVIQSFQQRYRASPTGVEPVFLPVWRLLMKTRGRGGRRVVTIDALAGKPLEW